jgi:hypothetical protein
MSTPAAVSIALTASGLRWKSVGRENCSALLPATWSTTTVSPRPLSRRDGEGAMLACVEDRSSRFDLDFLPDDDSSVVGDAGADRAFVELR